MPIRNAAVTTIVIDRAAPSTKSAELSLHLSVVARKTALRTCGPAIMTNDIGSRVRKLTRPVSPADRSSADPDPALRGRSMVRARISASRPRARLDQADHGADEQHQT